MSACKDCSFWTEDQKAVPANTGDCRRFPPQVVTVHGAGVIAIKTTWPQTHASDWCGEFIDSITGDAAHPANEIRRRIDDE